MPESVSGVDAILNQLRESGVGVLVGLASAETAVRAAADARTAEIVAYLTSWPPDTPTADGLRSRLYCADLIARRFPNGGTHDA